MWLKSLLQFINNRINLYAKSSNYNQTDVAEISQTSVISNNLAVRLEMLIIFYI